MRTPVLLLVALAFAIPAKSQTVQTLQAEAAALQAEIVLLKAAITAQGVAIAALQKQGAATQSTDTAQSASMAALQRQVTLIAQNPALQLGPFVSVDPNPEDGVTGPNILFTGANIHIVSGSGTTNDQTGKGNLIVGYNSAPVNLQPGQRAGSHNLVTGEGNTFTGSGGVVFGADNALGASFSSILGGENNRTGQITGELSVIVGGYNNGASGSADVVVGGSNNFAEGGFTVVLSGSGNYVDGAGSVIVSGVNNQINVAGEILTGTNIISGGPGGIFSGPITFLTPVQ